jgi:hypothetical protein
MKTSTIVRAQATANNESLRLSSAEDSFREGWREALRGKTIPIFELWEGIDAD